MILRTWSQSAGAPLSMTWLMARIRSFETPCRPLLAVRLVPPGGLVVDEGVAGVDLDEVVDQGHPEHPEQVDRRPGRLAEHERRDREVPGVLRVVLGPRAVREVVPAEHRLELVDLEQEAYLALQS